MSTGDVADWASFIELVQEGSGPISTIDVPDWSDPIAVLASGSPNADYPDFTKATTVTAGNLPTGTPPLPNPYAWWDAVQIPTQADNSSLSLWPDSSNNSHAAVQDGNLRPAYVLSGLNSLPSVKWGLGSAHNSLVSAILLAQPFTYISVLQITSTGVGVTFCSYGNDPFIGANVGTATYNVNAGTGSVTFGTTDTNPHMVIFVVNGASSTITVDGTTSGSLSPGTDGLGGGGFTLGGLGAPSPSSFTFTGLMGEVLLYPSALSAGQISTVHAYCQAKWSTP